MYATVLCLGARSCPTICDQMDCSLPGPSVHGGLSRQEYWSGLPCFPPVDRPNPGIKPRSPALQGDSLQSEPRNPKNTAVGSPSFLQGIFQTQESNQGSLTLQVDSLPDDLSEFKKSTN